MGTPVSKGIPYAEVIGDPVAHSKSPAIHKFWLEKLGLEGDYRATRVAKGQLPEYFEARRADPDWRGCNVTMPHKLGVAAFLDCIDPSADWAGSVNCVSWQGNELVGCNTDSSGIASAIEGARLEGAAVVIIGAGGAARTAWWSMDSEAVGETRLIARDPAQADRLLAAPKTTSMKGRYFAFEEAQDAFSGAALILNTTPLGMTGFSAMPQTILEAIPQSRIDALVADMVYHPLYTAFLSAARSFGRKTSDGLDMLVGQARDSFGHFFPVDPPSDDSDLRALLTS